MKIYKRDVFSLYVSYSQTINRKWVVVQALNQEHIVLLRLAWNARGVMTVLSDVVITVDLGFVPHIFGLTFKLVLVHSNILKE